MKEITQMDVQNMLGGQVLKLAQYEVTISEANIEIEKLRAEIKRLNEIANQANTVKSGSSK